MATARIALSTVPNAAEPPACDLGTVLVTGASGFIGGQIAIELAQAGYRVRAMSRREIGPRRASPVVEWVRGDLCNPRDLRAAVKDVRGVIHCGGWVSLTSDRRGVSRRVNVDATRDLLDHCAGAGVERFVYTSSLWTTAAGTAADPANEDTRWNLETVRSPYCETKREAERLVLARNGGGLETTVICPGMVVGPGDRRPSSTQLLLTMARWPVVFLPGGGIPLVDVRVVAEAHRKALEAGTPGRRYVVVGSYLSYRAIARWVRFFTARPLWIVPIPDWCGPISRRAASLASLLVGDHLEEISPATVAGGFLQLHVSGSRADDEFGLAHPRAERSIFDTLEDHRTLGRAQWLPPLRPVPEPGP